MWNRQKFVGLLWLSTFFTSASCSLPPKNAQGSGLVSLDLDPKTITTLKKKQIQMFVEVKSVSTTGLHSFLLSWPREPASVREVRGYKITTFVNGVVSDVKFMWAKSCRNGYCLFTTSDFSAGKVQFGIQMSLRSTGTTNMTKSAVIDLGKFLYNFALPVIGAGVQAASTIKYQLPR